MTASLELCFTPGAPDGFVEQLWTTVPAHPVGALVGVLHQAGDQGQILIRLGGPHGREIQIVPGQILHADDPTDPRTWAVLDPPDSAQLRLGG